MRHSSTFAFLAFLGASNASVLIDTTEGLQAVIENLHVYRGLLSDTTQLAIVFSPSAVQSFELTSVAVPVSCLEGPCPLFVDLYLASASAYLPVGKPLARVTSSVTRFSGSYLQIPLSGMVIPSADPESVAYALVFRGDASLVSNFDLLASAPYDNAGVLPFPSIAQTTNGGSDWVQAFPALEWASGVLLQGAVPTATASASATATSTSSATASAYTFFATTTASSSATSPVTATVCSHASTVTPQPTKYATASASATASAHATPSAYATDTATLTIPATMSQSATSSSLPPNNAPIVSLLTLAIAGWSCAGLLALALTGMCYARSRSCHSQPRFAAPGDGMAAWPPLPGSANSYVELRGGAVND